VPRLARLRVAAGFIQSTRPPTYDWIFWSRSTFLHFFEMLHGSPTLVRKADQQQPRAGVEWNCGHSTSMVLIGINSLDDTALLLFSAFFRRCGDQVGGRPRKLSS